MKLPDSSENLSEEVAKALGLTREGAEIVFRVRSGDPVRRPQTSPQTWAGAEYLDLMGFTVGVESRTLERAFYRIVPRQTDLVEIYDQPYELDLGLIRPDGKRLPSRHHVPDALCIRPNRVHFTECKPWSRLETLSLKNPDHFVLDDNDRWRSPAAERALAGTGIGYEVFTDRDVNPILLRNINYLKDYETEKNAPNELIAKIVFSFESASTQTIKDLISLVGDRRAIYVAITQGKIFFDFERDLASDDQSSVYRNEAIWKSNNILRSHQPVEIIQGGKFVPEKETRILLNNTQGAIIDLNDRYLWARLDNGSVHQLRIKSLVPMLLSGSLKMDAPQSELGNLARSMLANVTIDELERAIQTFMEIEPWVTGQKHGDTTRTIRRKIANFNTAKNLFGHGLVGLLDKARLRGNRKPRLSVKRESVMDDKIQNEYLDNCRSIKGTLSLINSELVEVGERRVGRKALVRRINRIPAEERENRRHGIRMGNSARAPHTPTDQPVKGERSFEVGLIDSFSVPQKVLSRRTGEVIKEPLWATLLWNAYPPYPLGLSLQFEKPSTRSVMAACRDCVRRHNRLPDNIYHDLGSEHGGLTFDLMKTQYSVSYLDRAAGNARFGADIEAHIGAFKTKIREYSGSYKVIPRRGGSASHSPEAKTKWFWEDFDEDLRQLAFVDWPEMGHEGIAAKPKILFEKSLFDQGERLERFIPYDNNFLVMTMPIVKNAAKIQLTRGVRYEYVWYHDRQLDDPQWRDAEVTIREPVDDSFIIVQLGSKWIRCNPVSYVFQLFSHRDQRLLLEEWRAEARSNNREERLTPEAYERFMRRIAEKERLFDEQRNSEKPQPCSPENGVTEHAPKNKSEITSNNREVEDEIEFDPDPFF